MSCGHTFEIANKACDEWAKVSRVIKELSTVSPNLVVKDATQEGHRQFLVLLQSIVKDLQEDYNQYVKIVWSPFSDELSVQGLRVRSEHAQASMCVRRFTEQFGFIIDKMRYFSRDESGHVQRPTITPRDHELYMSALFLPPTTVYHPKTFCDTYVSVDSPYHIQMMHLHATVNNLIPNGFAHATTPGGHVSLDNRDTADISDNGVLFARSRVLDSFIRTIVTLSSYPVVPDNLRGNSVLNVHIQGSNSDIPLTECGLNNRSRVCVPSSPRVCVSCKMHLLDIGLTNPKEQTEKYECECIISRKIPSGDYARELMSLRATSIVRLLTLNSLSQKSALPGMSCPCENHIDLLEKHMCKYLRTLEILYPTTQ